MATNFYFNNFGASQEQTLIEDLIIESIKIYGIDVYYIPRTVVNKDREFREAEYSSFNSSVLVEMYIRNINGFDGDGEFLSKFGLEVRDQIVFTMAQRVFHDEVGTYTSQMRPGEGDLVWFPLTQSLYQIKFTNVKPVFYQLGALQMYDMTCELYEGNSDIFNTGIPQIDDVYNALSLDTDGNVFITEVGDEILFPDNQQAYIQKIALESYHVDDIDPNAQNEEFERAGENFIDFSETDPFSEGGVRA